MEMLKNPDPSLVKALRSEYEQERKAERAELRKGRQQEPRPWGNRKARRRAMALNRKLERA